MSATMRLMRMGKRKQPFYRIIVLDKRKKQKGSYIEKIGQYDPLKDPQEIIINKARYDDWVLKGVQMSEGFSRLIKSKKKITFS